MASGGAAAALSPTRALVGVNGRGVARVFRTDDGGATWGSVAVRLDAIHAFAFASPDVGIAVGSGRGRTAVVRTTDGGRSFGEPASAGLGGSLLGAAFIPGTPRSVVAVGASGSTLSTDGGLSWRVVDRAAANGVSFAGPVDAGWKVGPGGTVWKLLRGRTADRAPAQPTPVAVSVSPHALGRRDPAPEAPPGATPTPLGSRPLKGRPTLTN